LVVHSNTKELQMLYKYRILNKRSLAMVLRPQLYFAPPASLNDPLEVDALLHIDGTKQQVVDHLTEYRQATLDNLSIERQSFVPIRVLLAAGDISLHAIYHRKLTRVYELEKRVLHAESMIQEARDGTQMHALVQLRGFYDQVLKPLRSSAICSLAGNPDNELMWAHYANEHRGICFEFDPSLFTRNKKVIERKVTYSRDGIVDVFQYGYRATFNLLFSMKSTAWKYENESRFFIYGDPRLEEVSHRALKSVILGYRFYSIEGLSEKALRIQRAQVGELRSNIQAINKSRQKGMKLKIMRIERKLYSFVPQIYETGQELDKMRAFSE